VAGWVGPKFNIKARCLFISSLIDDVRRIVFPVGNNRSDIGSLKVFQGSITVLCCSSKEAVVLIGSSSVFQWESLRIGKKSFHPCSKYVLTVGCPLKMIPKKYRFLFPASWRSRINCRQYRFQDFSAFK